MSSTNSVAYTSSTNLVPVQAEFNSAGVCVGLVGPGGAYFSPPLTGTTIDNTVIGGTTPAAVTGTDVYASDEIGYNASAQGAVTQATSKSTAVTLNKPTGQITMNAAALGAGASVSFNLNNTIVGASDILVLNKGNAGTNGNTYTIKCTYIAAGVAEITVTNNSAGSLSEAININFAIIKGATE